MSFFRKAYSVVGVLLLVEYLAQIYFIAGAIMTIENADDNAKSVYSAFKNADVFAGLHSINGLLVISATTLVLIGLSFAARHSWTNTGLTALLFVLLLLQSVLAHIPISVLGALHGVNALVMIGLAGNLTARNWAFRNQRLESGPATTN